MIAIFVAPTPTEIANWQFFLTLLGILAIAAVGVGLIVDGMIGPFVERRSRRKADAWRRAREARNARAVLDVQERRRELNATMRSGRVS